MQKNNLTIIFAFVIGLILVATGIIGLMYNKDPKIINNDDLMVVIKNNALNHILVFNGSQSWKYLVDQVEIGYRYPNSTEIENTRKYIIEKLIEFDWQVVLHNFSYKNIDSVNILAFPKNSDKQNVTMLGAHYDTRWKADKDPVEGNKDKPILGANDGASGVAVLLEFAEILMNKSDVALLFIDAEDQGRINGWSYIAGSTEFVKQENLNSIFPNGKNDISSFVLFDMIADWKLNIKKELNSNSEMINQIWSSANKLNYSNYFVSENGYSMKDDHVPFLNNNIPAIDLIDFDYIDEMGNNLHHTIKDDLDYVSENSLWIVGQTIEFWLKYVLNID